MSFTYFSCPPMNCFFAHPPGRRPGKNHLRSNWIFLGLWPGGWAFNFWHLFRFSMCYPKGAHSWHHRWGTTPRKYAITIFQCATPRGLICWVTVWGNWSLLGVNSIFHCATLRGLIHWVTVWGNGSLLGLNSIVHCAGVSIISKNGVFFIKALIWVELFISMQNWVFFL